MKRLYHALAAMLLVTPALALAQEQAERISTKQKLWLASAFRTGLSACAITPLKQGYAVSGTGVASFDDGDGDGLYFSIATAAGIAPTVTALAIKTKGTGAQRQRAVETNAAVRNANSRPEPTGMRRRAPTGPTSRDLRP